MVKRLTWLVLVAFASAACGPVSVTKTVYLETDTYISSADPENHAEQAYLKLSKSATVEERTIVKLPTRENDADSKDLANQILKDTFVALFLLPEAILAALLSCSADLFQPANLSSAYLDLDLQTDTEGSLAGKVELALLAKPWFQSTSWYTAYPFSRRGAWSLPGGDVDPGFTPVASTLNSNTLRFDITAYVKALGLASGQATHYGFLLRSKNPTLNSVSLYSVQSSQGGGRPRLVSTYTGTCVQSHSGWSRRTTYFGKDPVVIEEPVP